jgi:Pyruvate/2-oxoacid:ferredoxin oxidoreductase delta subunit
MKQLLILSGKGGTGKTTIASAFIKLSGAKIYADCDVDAPNLHLIMAQNIEPKRTDYFGMPKAEIDIDKCIECGLCKEKCRFDAISNENGFKVDPYACEGCGVCEAFCPAWKSFENILPQFLSILIIIGMMLAILTPEQISKLLGSESGWYGVLIAAVIGSITLIPGFVAFPLAAALLKSGAGYMQIAAFISTLMMVGIVTMPVEISYFGKKATIVRNVAAFGFSFIVALVMGVSL